MFTHIKAYKSVPKFQRKKVKIAYHTPDDILLR